MSDAPTDGPATGTGGRGRPPKSRSTSRSAPPPPQVEDAAADDAAYGDDPHELRVRLADARNELAAALDTIGDLGNTVVALRAAVSEGQLREAQLASDAERVGAVLDRERLIHEAWVRDALLGSALDGLSTSLQNLDTTLFERLAPLSALTTLTTAGRTLEPADLSRLAAVQQATARIDANSYVTGRATPAPEAPPAEPAAAS